MCIIIINTLYMFRSPLHLLQLEIYRMLKIIVTVSVINQLDAQNLVL